MSEPKYVCVPGGLALLAVLALTVGCGSSSHATAASSSVTSPARSATVAPPIAPSTPAPNTPRGYPNASTTGVPPGTKLTTYLGPTDLKKCGTLIDAKIILGDVNVESGSNSSSPSKPCVTITNSVLMGTINTGPDPGKLGPLVMRHVEVAPPRNSLQQAVVGSNFYLYDVNIHGGANGGVDCAGYCGIYDSWVHDFYLAGATHYDAVMTNGLYSNAPMVIEHNTLDCEFSARAAGATGGCSADIGLYGDFATTSNVTVKNNVFIASTEQAYCFYGGSEESKKFPNASHVVVTGNMFQRGTNGKCAGFGPVAYFSSTAPGNVWSGNIWSDGHKLTPPPN